MRYKDETHAWIYIPDADAERIIAHVAPRWKLAVKLLFTYGMRVSELLSLTPENFKNGVMVLQRLKRGKLTHQIIAADVREELEKLIASMPKPLVIDAHTLLYPRLFPIRRVNIWRRLQEAANRAGVNPVLAHAHAFRHRCGRKWAREGTIMEVAAMLGHRSIQATMMYTDLECDPNLSRKFLH